MSKAANKKINIFGNLCLGKYPAELGEFSRVIAQKRSLEIAATFKDTIWFDQTMLCSLALQIRASKRPNPIINLKFSTDQKYSFLWRSGFFSISKIGHAGSPFQVSPNIFEKQPRDPDKRANFTPIIPFDTTQKEHHPATVRGYSENAKATTYDLLAELEKTTIYSHVQYTDLMQSKEYLHVVLWELVQNAIDHAGTGTGAVAAQIFVNGDYDNIQELAGLNKQHSLEEEYCAMPLKKEWLARNSASEYLMLTCVDNGIGIPAHIRQRKKALLNI